jgi:hypothetical protein
MTGRPTARRFWFGAAREPASARIVQLPHPLRAGAGRRPVHISHQLRGLRDHIGNPPDPLIEDLFTIAVACVVADRFAVRGDIEPIRRHIDIDVPLRAPQTWSRPEVTRALQALLELTTGDEWRTRFHPDPNPWQWQPQLAPDPVDRVALFSGGLDSFCHIAQRHTSRTVLVSHYASARVRDRQRELRAALNSPNLLAAEFLVNVTAPAEPQRLEPAPRSRTLLNLAAGALVCSANSVAQLEIPETALLALNPTMRAAWVGGSVAAPAHPMTVQLANELFQALGAGPRVVNPMLGSTKADACERVLGLGFKRTLLGRTITCATPQRIDNGRFGNCGYCYFCLVRHAALVRAGGDLTEYREVYPPEISFAASGPHRRDLMALRGWLGRGFGIADLSSCAPLPPGIDTARLLEVVSLSRQHLAEIYPPLH